MNNVQKILLGLVATTSIATASFAAETESFYLTISGGIAKQAQKPGAFSTTDATNQNVSGNFKNPKIGGMLAVGAGYYVMDNVRAELVYFKPFLAKVNTKSATIAGAAADRVGSVKTEINAFQVKGCFDALDISDMGKAYVSLGIGVAQSKMKLDNSVTSASSKNKVQLSWSIGVGFSFPVGEGVSVKGGYEYVDCGKIKYSAVKGAPSGTTGSNKLAAHILSAGLGLDL